MKQLFCVLLLVIAGCSESAELTAMKAAFEAASETVTVKQNESLTILKENTTALAAIKSQVESFGSALQETRQAVGTMEASLVKSEPQQLGGDLESSRSGKPGNDTEPVQAGSAAANTQGAPRANLSQPSIPVAQPPAVRSSANGLKMTWNVEGNWNPTILETAKHLREDHGIIADGMTHQQMHDAHAAAHEGRKPVAVRAQSVQIINRGTSCPGGVCPTRQSVRMRWRR